MNLLDHRQSNAVCRHINAMWRMRGVGGARVHRGERGFVIEGGARTTDLTTPDSFDGDKEVRQFLLTRVQKLLPGSIGGAYNDWSDQAGVIEDLSFRLVLRLPFHANIRRATLYLLNDGSTFNGSIWSTDDQVEIHAGVPYSTTTGAPPDVNYATWYPGTPAYDYTWQYYVDPVSRVTRIDANARAAANWDGTYYTSGPWLDPDNWLAFQRTAPLRLSQGGPVFTDATTINNAYIDGDNEALTSSLLPNRDHVFYLTANRSPQDYALADAFLNAVPAIQYLNESHRVMVAVDAYNYAAGSIYTYKATISLDQFIEDNDGKTLAVTRAGYVIA
jgi:hypothetical protein